MLQIKNCDDVVFHFNKKHLENPIIPPWVLKAKGQTFYAQHVECHKGWSTKETPDNPSTKGSINMNVGFAIGGYYDVI